MRKTSLVTNAILSSELLFKLLIKAVPNVKEECGVDFLMIVLLMFWKKLHFLKLFRQYFENVCSKDLMNKMQLRWLTTERKGKSDKMEPSV